MLYWRFTKITERRILYHQRKTELRIIIRRLKSAIRVSRSVWLSIHVLCACESASLRVSHRSEDKTHFSQLAPFPRGWWNVTAVVPQRVTGRMRAFRSFLKGILAASRANPKSLSFPGEQHPSGSQSRNVRGQPGEGQFGQYRFRCGKEHDCSRDGPSQVHLPHSRVFSADRKLSPPERAAEKDPPLMSGEFLWAEALYESYIPL